MPKHIPRYMAMVLWLYNIIGILWNIIEILLIGNIMKYYY